MTPQKKRKSRAVFQKVGKSRARDQKVGKSRKVGKVGPAGQPVLSIFSNY